MQYTNKAGLPLSIAVWLATDDYEHQADPDTLSVTTLLKPIRQIVLAKRAKAVGAEKEVDVSDLIASRLGTAIHDSLEKSWFDPGKALARLKLSQKVKTNLVINPTPEYLEANPDAMPIFIEQRSFKKVGKYTITGKFDIVMMGQVEDYKSTGVFSWIKKSNEEKHKMQGSMYRWLNPDKITSDVMGINYIFTDWSKVRAQGKDYPKSRIVQDLIPLHSIDVTDDFVKNKLKQVDYYAQLPEDKIPYCTDEDLWRRPTVWKYYAKPGLVRSTKNFEDFHEASKYLHEQGSVGHIKEVKGEVLACNYCAAANICTQREQLIEAGDLITG